MSAPRALGALLGACLVCLTVVPGSAAAGPAPAAVPVFAPTTLPVGPYPADLAVGDVNADGLPDLVTANNGAKNVSVRLAQPGGTFGPLRNWRTEDAANKVAVADVDGDGAADLVVLMYGATQAPALTVLRGDGTGLFGAPIVTPASNAGAFAVGDVNADGRADAVVTSGTSSGLVVHLGRPDGGFDLGATLAVAGFPASVTLADLDADGNLDLATADINPGTVSVLLGDGTGGFGAPRSFPAAPGPFVIDAADMDGDGRLDLVSLNRGIAFPPDLKPPSISVLRGDGRGAFGVARTSSVPKGPNDLALGDIDGDGRLDAVVPAGVDRGYLALLLGDGTGRFPVRDRVPFGGLLTLGCCPFSVAVADLDGDARLDLAVADANRDVVTVGLAR